MITKACRLYERNLLRPKKNTCGSGSRPTLFFSADPVIFSTWLTVRLYFLQVVAGYCQNGVCCHLFLKKTRKKYSKRKFISDLPTLIFSRYETGPQYFF
jgi:hypothetical protein